MALLSSPRPPLPATAPRPAPARTPSTRPDRPSACVYVDLENLLGTARGVSDVAEVWTALVAELGLRDDDRVVVATGPALARVAMFVLPMGRVSFKIGRGLSGADHALLAEIDLDWIAGRGSELWIASGDGVFGTVVRAARSRSIPVVQVLGAGLPSAALSRACGRRQRLALAA